MTTVASAAAAIVTDPCLFEVSQLVMKLHDAEQGPVKPGTPKPPTPGIGLCSAVKPLRAVVYVKQRPWILPLGIAAVVGGLFGLGYMAEAVARSLRTKGTMSKTYFTDRVQGVGAIAAAAPAPRSAPAPSFGKLARRADPMLNLPTTSRVGPAKVVLRGGSPVVVRTASLARPYALMSGVRRGPRPLMGMGGLGATNLGEAGISGQGGGGRGPIRSRGATVAARAQIAGMKSGAYVPPSAPQGGGTPGMTTRQPVQQVMTGLSTAPLRVQPPKVQTFPGPPPAAPRIGYGIGQEPGPVLATPPSPYGPGVSSPTSPPGSGLDVNPVLEQYDPNTGMTELEPVLVTSASASSGGHGPLLLLGGGLVVLYLLTRKRRRS